MDVKASPYYNNNDNNRIIQKTYIHLLNYVKFLIYEYNKDNYLLY